MLFDDLAIDPRCLSVLKAQEIETPTPIQEAAIPVALEGRDIVALAQTGTGKTLAFTLPALTRLAQGHVTKNQMLVLTPTRELAVQVHSVIETMAKAVNMRSACIYGGVNLDQQSRKLSRGAAVIVATPGRLLDHMNRGNLHFHDLEVLVIDEADRMLDMGFLPDIRRILRTLPKERQTILCSATFPNEIARLSEELLHDPERLSVGAVHKPVDSVLQLLYTVPHERKTSLVTEILRKENVESALVFLRTKQRTDRVAESLRKAGIKAQAIHGDLSQRQREKALKDFREGQVRVLVATDVAARGLDVDGISHVINFDIPDNADDYLHRIGRTARANAEGHAITFVCPDDHMALESIERSLGKNLPRAEWEHAVSVLSLYTPPVEHKTNKSGTYRRPKSLFRRR